jgi:anti-sigma factor RsiW
MPAQERHLTDREILQGLDGELTESRRPALDRHLSECAICGARRAEIASTAAAMSADYRSTMTPSPGVDFSRARLEAALAREANEQNRSRFTPASSIAVAAMVVLAATATMYFRAPAHAPETVHHGLSLPVASITPGATWDVSVDELCMGATRTRPITDAMRAEVLSAYGVENVPSDEYELDYLITPELGGATDVRNLWPQRYGSPVWNARVKDELEELLPRLVCSRELDLATAQRDMASDWIAAYKKYFNTEVPLDAHRGPAIDEDDVYLMADAGTAPAIRLVSFTSR